MLVSLFGSLLVAVVYIMFGRFICALFGADAATIDYTVKILPQYSLGFIFMALNTMLSAYMYSTERSSQATIISVLRSISINAAIILLLPNIFGESAVWFTFACYEAIVLMIAAGILKYSERNGIIYQ